MLLKNVSMKSQINGNLPPGQQSVVTTLCIPIHTPRFMRDILDDVAYKCNIARNAMIRHWLRWREDNPDYQGGTTSIQKRGKETKNPRHASIECQYGMIACGRSVVPDIASSIVASALFKEINEHLQARMPYNHHGRERFRWSAILKHEVQATTFRNISIPVKKDGNFLCWNGLIFPNPKSKAAVANLEKQKSQLVLRVTLFSKSQKHGCQHMLHLRPGRLDGKRSGFTPRQKQQLFKIMSGEDGYKWCDSEIVQEDGKWFFHLVYKQPVRNWDLNSTKAATLTWHDKDSGSEYPLSINAPGAEKPWTLGENNFYAARLKHFNDLKRQIRRAHSLKVQERNGRGRQRFQQRIRPINDSITKAQIYTRNGVICDAIRYCINNRCGVLRFCPPNAGEKSKTWFSKHELDWAWEKFAIDLESRCMRNGIRLAILDASGNEKPARKPQHHGPQSVADNAITGDGVKVGVDSGSLANREESA